MIGACRYIGWRGQIGEARGGLVRGESEVEGG